MLAGDWFFGVLAAIVIAFFARGFIREREQGITGIRADVPRQRTMVGLGCTLVVALGFAVWGVLWILSDEVMTGSTGFLAGVPIHQRTLGLFALALGGICVYMATRFMEHLRRGTVEAPVKESGEEEAEPDWRPPGLASAIAAWGTHKKKPGPDGLARAVRTLVEAGWGLRVERVTIAELRTVLEENEAPRAAELAVGLLEELDAIRYGGAELDQGALNERFDELVELADAARSPGASLGA